MKKFILPLVIVLLSGLIILNYLAYKSPPIKKMISQQTLYQTKESELTISLFSNHKGPYQHSEAIESLYLLGEGKRLELVLVSIYESTRYKYLDETYTMYNYVVTIPPLTAYFFIEDALLEIHLKQGKSTTFSIGSFDYYHPENSQLDLITLHATKYDDAYQIKDVTMAFNLAEPILVHDVVLSNKISISIGEEVMEELVFTVPKQPLIIDCLSLVINYEIRGISYQEVLPYYLFFDGNENRLTYGYLNHVYIID